jgi:hypothetical protein
MKKISKFLLYLAGNILILFTAGMLMTFVNDAIQHSGFFGDVLRTAPLDRYHEEFIKDGYDWGARHYWYFWMCVAMFIIGVIRVVLWVDYYWTDKKD